MPTSLTIWWRTRDHLVLGAVVVGGLLWLLATVVVETVGVLVVR